MSSSSRYIICSPNIFCLNLLSRPLNLFIVVGHLRFSDLVTIPKEFADKACSVFRRSMLHSHSYSNSLLLSHHHSMHPHSYMNSRSHQYPRLARQGDSCPCLNTMTLVYPWEYCDSSCPDPVLSSEIPHSVFHCQSTHSTPPHRHHLRPHS